MAMYRVKLARQSSNFQRDRKRFLLIWNSPFKWKQGLDQGERGYVRFYLSVEGWKIEGGKEGVGNCVRIALLFLVWDFGHWIIAFL